MSQSDFQGRVLYIARAPFVSGAERSMLAMIRHLDRQRVEPRVILGHETAMLDHFRAMDVPVTVIPLAKRATGAGLWPWWRSRRAIEREVARFKPGVMHANDIPSSQAMSVVGRRRKVARVAHIRWTIRAEAAGWWLCQGVEAVISISQWIRDQLGPVEGTTLAGAVLPVVVNAVDWPSQLSADVPPPPMRQAQGGEGLTLGFAGQLIESKGLDLVIQAMGRLPASSRPRLLVAGEDTQTQGRCLERLQALAKSQGVEDAITWRGFVEDIASFFKEVDAVVCPSREEPLGRVPLEAAEHARPALANRLGGFLETIVHQETGLHVEPTPDAWAEALQSLDAQSLRSWGLAAWRRTQTLYSPRAYQDRLMTIYQRAAGKRRSL